MIHEGFSCNRRVRKSELIAVFFLRARIIQRALDLASAVATHLAAGGLATLGVSAVSSRTLVNNAGLFNCRHHAHSLCAQTGFSHHIAVDMYGIIALPAPVVWVQLLHRGGERSTRKETHATIIFAKPSNLATE